MASSCGAYTSLVQCWFNRPWCCLCRCILEGTETNADIGTNVLRNRVIETIPASNGEKGVSARGVKIFAKHQEPQKAALQQVIAGEPRGGRASAAVFPMSSELMVFPGCLRLKLRLVVVPLSETCLHIPHAHQQERQPKRPLWRRRGCACLCSRRRFCLSGLG